MSGRSWGAVLVAGVLVLGVGACSSPGGEPATGSSASPTRAGMPTGEPFVVEPLTSIDGAESWTRDGVTLEVPAGLEKQRREGDELVTLGVYEPGAPQDALVVTIVPEQDGPYTEMSVNDSAAVTRAQLATSGATELTISPVEWSAWPYATAVQGLIEQDGLTKEGGLVQTMTQDGSSLVSISVKAPQGELEESWQYEVLRTVRPAS